MIENKSIKIKEIEVNKGQIYGLPKNPRFIRDERFEALKKSIEDAPEMLTLRELLVYPYNDKYVVIGGNMRLRACIDLGYKEVPCKILDEETPVVKLREYAIKDNEAFGQNDWDILSNDWDKEELKEWGMETPIDCEEEQAENVEVEGEEHFTEVLGEEHNYIVLYFDNEVDWLQAQSLFDIKQVKNLSTRKDGQISKGMESKGIGRVIKGRDAINKIMEMK